MILITTSKEPTQRINSFARDLKNSIPNARVLRRGKRGTRELPKAVTAEGCDRLAIIHRWHGGPGKIEFYKLNNRALVPFYPVLVLHSVTLRREYLKSGRFRVQGLTCDNDDSTTRLVDALSDFLQLSREKTDLDVSLHVTRSNDRRLRISVTDLSSLEEVGPSMVIDRLIWKETDGKS